MPLGFSRFAYAWPSMNLGANVSTVGTSFVADASSAGLTSR
jgi:hypothetical protein